MALPRVPASPPAVADRNLAAWMSAVTDLLRSFVAGGTSTITGFESATVNTVFAGPSTGSAAAPAFRALVAGDLPAHTHAWTEISKTGSSLADLATRAIADTTGTLGVTRGGTGLATLATGSLLYASATDTLSALPPAAVDRVLTSSSGGTPQWSASIAHSALPIGVGTWTLNGQLTFSSGNLLATRSTNGVLSILAENPHTGTAAIARMGTQTGTANQGVTFELHGSGYTPNGARRPLWGMVNAQSALSGLVLAAQKTGATIEVYTGGLSSGDLRGTWSATGLALTGGLAVEGNLGFFGAPLRAQGAAITAPSGGATIDAEARTAISAILTLLSEAAGGFGLTA